MLLQPFGLCWAIGIFDDHGHVAGCLHRLALAALYLGRCPGSMWAFLCVNLAADYLLDGRLKARLMGKLLRLGLLAGGCWRPYLAGKLEYGSLFAIRLDPRWPYSRRCHYRSART